MNFARFGLSFVLALITICRPVTATTVAVTYDAVGDVRDAVHALLFAVPMDQRRFDSSTGVLKLRGPIALWFENVRPNVAPGYMIEVARRLSGFGSVGPLRLDVADADVRLISAHEAWTLERVGGSGGRRSQQEYVQLIGRGEPTIDVLTDQILATFRRLRNLRKGGRTFRLQTSVFFDLRLLPLDLQADVTNLLRVSLRTGGLNGRALNVEHATVHVLRDETRVGEDVPIIPTRPPPPAQVDFVRNPRYRTVDHLKYFLRKIPLTQFRWDESTMRLRGFVGLRDDALTTDDRRALRAAMTDLLAGRTSIAGATVDASAATVEFIGALSPCDGTLRVGGP